MTGIRRLGNGGDDFRTAAPRLTVDELTELALVDPRDGMTRARLGGLRYRLARRTDPSGRLGHVDPNQRLYPHRFESDVKLLDWLDEWQERPDTARRVWSVPNPAKIEGERDQRELTAAELEYLRRFEGVDPSKVPAEDVALLAEIAAVAATPIERQLVERSFAAIRRHHDLLAERGELLDRLDEIPQPAEPVPQVRQAVQDLLARRLADDARAELEPHLSPDMPAAQRKRALEDAADQAYRQAPQRIRSLFEERAAAAAAEAAPLRARLAELVAGAAPVSSAPRRPDPGVAESRRRGEEWAQNRSAARAARESAFDNLGRRVGEPA